MANFGDIQLTNKGLAAQLKAQAGVDLTFSSIKMGSGTYSGSIATLTNLVNTELSANISNGTLSDTAYTVQAQFTNSSVTTGFYWRELGLFAKDSSGNEFLYGYANCGNQADYIPAVTDTVYTKHVSIAISVGSATNISIVNPANTYLDVTTFNSYKSQIDASLANMQTAINNAASTSDLDSIKSDLENSIQEVSDYVSYLEGLVNTLNGKMGSGGISIGGNTNVVSALNYLYQLIQNIPAITSGTAEPSGGNDGDVYIQYE